MTTGLLKEDVVTVSRERSLRGLTALLVALTSIGACSNDGGSGSALADSADSTVTAVSAVEQPETTTALAPAVFEQDVPVLIDRSVPLSPDTYRVDTIGTPFSFAVDEPMFVQWNDHGWFVITHPGSRGPDDRDVVFIRATSLADPTDPTVLPDSAADGWPATDYSGWLDNLSSDVVVTNRRETTLGGLEATRVDIELGQIDCDDAGDACMMLSTNHFFDGKYLVPGSSYRVWFVEQDGLDVLVVVVGISSEADREWFDAADRLLSTLAFGEVQANPAAPADAGSIELPFLGGIRTELPSPAMVFDEAIGTVSLSPDEPAETFFLTNPLDLAGDSLSTADDLVVALQASGTEVIELDPVSVDSIDARVFDIGSGASPDVLKIRADARTGWAGPPRGRIWLIEHPDRGLLMVSSEAFGNVDTVFPIVVAHTESMIESLEFVELD